MCEFALPEHVVMPEHRDTTYKYMYTFPCDYMFANTHFCRNVCTAKCTTNNKNLTSTTPGFFDYTTCATFPHQHQSDNLPTLLPRTTPPAQRHDTGHGANESNCAPHTIRTDHEYKTHTQQKHEKECHRVPGLVCLHFVLIKW